MKIKLFTFLVMICISIHTFPQAINVEVYNKPLPEIITVPNQPNDIKFTSHIVNIKIPSSLISDWNADIEKNYIETVLNFIPDKHFVIAQYSGFYFPESAGLTGAHHINYKNTVQNIGLEAFDFEYLSNSDKFLGLTRLERDWYLRPNIVTHELFHQWNSYLESANYWLIDPSHHTGLVEQSTSVFENYCNDFQPMSGDRYRYKQYISNGFVSELEGYLAGLWDMPDNLRTLKNYYHGEDVTHTFNESCNCWIVENVQADGIVDLEKNQLFQMYGGERIPNYLSNDKSYDCVVIVFSAENFLNDNDLKVFHYASILEETEGTPQFYNEKYDEVFILQTYFSDPDYGKRQLNPYHATYMNLHFYTNIFNSPLSNNEYNLTLSDKISIYPNPTKSILNFSEKVREVTVYDLSGRIMKTVKTTLNVLDISSIPNGNYILKVVTEKGEKFIKKIIKK